MADKLTLACAKAARELEEIVREADEDCGYIEVSSSEIKDIAAALRRALESTDAK